MTLRRVPFQRPEAENGARRFSTFKAPEPEALAASRKAKLAASKANPRVLLSAGLALKPLKTTTSATNATKLKTAKPLQQSKLGVASKKKQVATIPGGAAKASTPKAKASVTAPRRTSFKAPEWTPAPRATLVQGSATSRAVMRHSTDMVVSIQKREYVRSKPLMVAYRSIPCQLCWVEDNTICGAHSNSQADGKGRSIKADDRRCASMCSRCHHEIDFGKLHTKAEKRHLWELAHNRTIVALVAAGAWPPGIAVPEPIEIEEATFPSTLSSIPLEPEHV